MRLSDSIISIVLHCFNWNALVPCVGTFHFIQSWYRLGSCVHPKQKAVAHKWQFLLESRLWMCPSVSRQDVRGLFVALIPDGVQPRPSPVFPSSRAALAIQLLLITEERLHKAPQQQADWAGLWDRGLAVSSRADMCALWMTSSGASEGACVGAPLLQGWISPLIH